MKSIFLVCFILFEVIKGQIYEELQNLYTEFNKNHTPNAKIGKIDKLMKITYPVLSHKSGKYIWVPFIIDSANTTIQISKITYSFLFDNTKNNDSTGNVLEFYGCNQSISNFTILSNNNENINVLGTYGILLLKLQLLLDYPNSKFYFCSNSTFCSAQESFNLYDLHKNSDSDEVRVQNQEKFYEEQDKIRGLESKFSKELTELNQLIEIYTDIGKRYFDTLNYTCQFMNKAECIELEKYSGYMTNFTMYDPAFSPYYTVNCNGIKDFTQTLRREDLLEIGQIFSKNGLIKISVPVKTLNYGYLWVPFEICSTCKNTTISYETYEIVFKDYKMQALDIEIMGINLKFVNGTKNYLGIDFLGNVKIYMDFAKKKIGILPPDNGFSINWPAFNMRNPNDCIKIVWSIQEKQRDLKLKTRSEILNDKKIYYLLRFYSEKIEELGNKIREVYEKLSKNKIKADL